MTTFARAAVIDQGAFHLLNGAWTSPLLDRVMPALSALGNLGAVWLALLALLAVFGRETGRKMALAGLVAFAIGFASSELIKELTLRPRPFLALDHVRLLVPEPRSYAFPSGHATNSFAVATGVILSARRLLEKVPLRGWGMLGLAVLVSYSRIYVGVHWPTDVAAGAILGLFCGWAGARLVGTRWRRRRPAEKAQEAYKIPGEAREVEYEIGR